MKTTDAFDLPITLEHIANLTVMKTQILIYAIPLFGFLASCDRKPQSNTPHVTTDKGEAVADPINKLTSKEILERMGIKDEGSRSNTWNLADVNKITDQNVLAEIAIKANQPKVRSAAAAKVAEPVSIARIAVEAKDLEVRRKALNEIDRKIPLEKYKVESGTDEMYNPVKTVLSALNICAAIPQQYKERIALYMIDMLQVLSDPQIIAEKGNLLVTVQWKTTQQAYGTSGGWHSVSGELVSCSIDRENQPGLYSHIWETKFPGGVYENIRFIEAEIHISDLLAVLFGNLSKSTLEHLANSQYSEAQLAAAWKLGDLTILAKVPKEDVIGFIERGNLNKVEDQSVLARLVNEEREAKVRCAAVLKITNQTLLAKLAIEEPDRLVRANACKNLKEKTLLAKLALEDKDSYIRSAVCNNITDQTLLEKLALEDKDSYVRSAACKNLTDQKVITKIAIEDKDDNVRLMAAQRLVDNHVLSEISKTDKSPYVRDAAKKRLDDFQW